MSTPSVPSPYPPLLQWLALILCSALVGGGLSWLQVPAALFLGPMLVAIAFGVGGATIRLPRRLFQTGQGVVGCLIAHAMTAAVLLTVAEHWPVMLLATALTVLLSLLTGALLVRFGGLPGSTAAWGTTPGAAAAMVAMAEEYGADPRIVATMQYVRVVCVVLISALVGRLLGAEGSWLGGRLFPAGALLLPIALGTLLQLNGWLDITLPHLLLAAAYGAMGCYVGLRFDRVTVAYVWRALPKMIFASLLLIALCALSALLMARLMHVDFLTAYLATSPGGLDSMAIIAVDAHADVGLVLAMQALRLIGVVLTGPLLARQLVKLART